MMRRLLAGGLMAIILIAGAAAQTYDVPISVRNSEIRVFDGDTIRLKGDPVSIRLVGFNPPETSQRSAACPAEIEHGKRARTRLRELLSSGPLTLTYVRCACRPGTHGTSDCNHGRACGTLRVRGADIGDLLIGEGHAVPYACSGTSCPKLPRPWCDAAKANE